MNKKIVFPVFIHLKEVTTFLGTKKILMQFSHILKIQRSYLDVFCSINLGNFLGTHP